jgi:hypothetical protein
MVMINCHLPPLGFVIAVRATIVGRSGASHKEWLIASRWGHAGSYLSVARTLVRAGMAATAPMHLAPRWSALAVLDAHAAVSTGPCFAFTARPPDGVRLAGRFAPSVGSVLVEGRPEAIRLRGDAHCLGYRSQRDFQFDGVRVAWVGEFIEPGT